MQRTLFLSFCLVPFLSFGQLDTKIFVDAKEEGRYSFQDSLELVSYINSTLLRWMQEQYYFAGVDSTKKSGDLLLFYLHKGQKAKGLLKAKRKSVVSQLERSVQKLADQGYPFARVTFFPGKYDGKLLEGDFQTQKGPEITYDSAFFIYPFKGSKTYLYRALDIEPGAVFSESDYRLLTKKMDRLEAYTLERQPDIAFEGDKAQVFLALVENPTNSFQGIVGLQQQSNNESTVVGSLDLELNDLFKSGKQLKFVWERFREASQELEMHYVHPLIFNSKVDPVFSFQLLKQDTTFVTRSSSIGFSTYISPQLQLQVDFEAQNGSLLATELSTVSTSKIADYERSVYSFGLSKGQYRTLNYRRFGCAWDLNIGLGRKTIRKNPALPDAFYDTIKAETNVLQIKGRFNYQLKLGRFQALFHDVRLGYLRNDELLTNELFRLGGLTTLRGFDEKVYFTEVFALSRIECRSFFEERSYAYVFFDQAVVGESRATPLGFGLGFALETSSGQFSFALASGSEKIQTLSMANVKAHFGFTSQF